MKFKWAALIVFYILTHLSSFCQFKPLIKNILLIDAFNTDHPREKIFIHYDRLYYNIIDTLWLKGYVLSAKDCATSDSSKIAYIEIINSSGKLIKRVSTYCSSGIFYSNIALNKTDFKQGIYLLRAYTNYLRNYGDSLSFESQFKIIDPASHEWKLSVHNISLLDNRFNLTVAIKPTLKQSAQQQDVSVILRSKAKIIFKQKIVSDRNGSITIDTLLAKQSTGDTLQLEISNDDNLKIQLPVYSNKEDKIDLQFLPEGGSFITGKLQRLGFKAVNIFGQGINVRGKIVNSKNQLITTFMSVHKGMGIVWLKPDMNEKYDAVLDNGLTFQLPIARQSGTQLQIINHPGADSVEVIIDASPDLYDKQYFFRANARGISCAMGVVRIKDQPYRLAISKKAFPSGICRFTLYDSTYLPVNERITLIWHHDDLKLNLTAQKPFYANRDSVHILLTAKNPNNEPSVGSFSVSVIDTGKIYYPEYAENIISYMLLSSDIKGNIEEPYYYFNYPLPEATEALMLTQGWVQYDHFSSNQEYECEKQFTISGNVVNLFNKPVAKTDITLLGKDGRLKTFISETETDKNGHFTLKDFPIFTTDSVNMIVRALNKKGKSFGVSVDIDLPVFPRYKAQGSAAFKENILYDPEAAHYATQQAKLDSLSLKEKGVLPEVIVNSRIKISGSKNLNPDGGADQVITQKVLETMPKQNLLDVFSKEVPGFHKGNLPRSTLLAYKINGYLVVFVIDGYNINQVYDPISESSTAFTEYEENYLKYIAAEDVVGIEIMNSKKNTFAYEKYYSLTSSDLLGYVFIEITTYSGHGAFDKKIPGMYLYRPLVPVIGKTFYSPRYSSTGNDIALPDYRSTLYWNPDIITNEKGEAEFSFYTSDNSSSYLIIVQGTDLKGGLGAAYLPLSIKK